MVSVALCVIPTILIVLTGIRKFRERLWGYCKNKVKLDNKVVLITGANCGIGFEIAKELATRNAQIILACRNIQLAKEAIAKIEKYVKKEVKMSAMELDLASLKSIQDFATNVQNIYPKIDILINNAGVAYPKKEIHQTADGLEIHFGVNHLGHFYLTNLLMGALRKSRASRVVVVSSILHQKGVIDVDNLKKLPQTSGSNLYANSKLANVYFSRELARRVARDGVSVYTICPGWVYTSLFRHSIKWYHYILVAPIAFLFMRSPLQGAQTAIYCATDPGLAGETGLMYRDCKMYLSKVKFDDNIAAKLWDESERIINESIKLK